MIAAQILGFVCMAGCIALTIIYIFEKTSAFLTVVLLLLLIFLQIPVMLWAGFVDGRWEILALYVVASFFLYGLLNIPAIIFPYIMFPYLIFRSLLSALSAFLSNLTWRIFNASLTLVAIYLLIGIVMLPISWGLADYDDTIRSLILFVPFGIVAYISFRITCRLFKGVETTMVFVSFLGVIIGSIILSLPDTSGHSIITFKMAPIIGAYLGKRKVDKQRKVRQVEPESPESFNSSDIEQLTFEELFDDEDGRD